VRRPATPAGGYKLIAVDLDGTFLSGSGEPHEADLAALRRCMDAGVVVTIATGRLYPGTRPAAEAVGIQGLVACADGSHIVRASDHVTIKHNGMHEEATRFIKSSVSAYDLPTFLFAADRIVHDDAGGDFVPYVRTWSDDVRRTERVVDHPLWDERLALTAVVALGDEESLLGCVERMREHISHHVQIAAFPLRRMGTLWGMIARASSDTKGSALAEIARSHGLELDQCVAVGDWMNDVPMLEAAGRSFAMGQAPPEVKASATDQLEETSVVGGGVARAVSVCFGL
jgi:Cof subfamily protein (haloacid dehalogenase superfamily)